MDPPKLLQDDLFWLRDDTRKNEEVLELLRQENAYTAAQTDHLDAFRGALYEEMLSHVQEDDDTFPAPSPDGFEYWSRTVKGKSFRQYLRRPRGESTVEETILDVNLVPTLPFFSGNPDWDPSQCDVGAVTPDPSGRMLAYCVDGSGYETYNIRFKDLSSGEELDDQIQGTDRSCTWADESTVFYVTLDEQHRPFRVWRHRMGTRQADDVLVYEDLDELFNVACWKSRDGSMLFIESESKETTEMRFVPASTPESSPTVIRSRQYGVRYDVDSHAPSRSLYITSNVDGKVNRELLVASIEAPSQWQPVRQSEASGRLPVLPHSQARSLDGVEAFEDFVVVSGREEGFTQLWVVPLSDSSAGEADRLSFEDDSFQAFMGTNHLFQTKTLRVEYSSMVAPRALREYSLADRSYQTLKVMPVPGYDPGLYETRRIEVAARDGSTSIPVTLLWRPDAVEEGKPAPCHLYGYGSYGVCIDPSFAASRLALVDRGVIVALAHIRGGGEMGHYEWYEKAGKYLQKQNTFTDFVDCAQALLDQGVAEVGSLSCEGRSAGGLLMGNVINLAPETFCACVAGVPFVDLMVTMCDPSIPLTTEEWEEWGNPNEEKYHDYMMSYSPINNVRPGVRYPPTLIVSGLNDPRVAYWEPTKWAQTLRAEVENGDEILLKMDLAAGHFSAADRYRYLRELAFDYAWLLDKHGKAD